MKFILLTSIFIFTNMASAGTKDICLEIGPFEKFQKEILETIDSVKDCPSFDELIFKQVSEEYEKFYGNQPKSNGDIKGFTLAGTAEEIRLANKMLGASLPAGWSEAAGQCQDIQCAFEKLLDSKEAAMQLFNIPAKSGYVLSLDQTINQNKKNQIWSPREIRELDAAVSKLPPELTKLPRLTEIDRMADTLRLSKHEDNVAAFARHALVGSRKEAELVIYDNGLRFESSGASSYDIVSWPQEVLLHELCHHHDYKGYYESNGPGNTSARKNAGFRGLSGWEEQVVNDGGDKWVHSPDAKFVSEYSKKSPAEDYAESCMNYILRPDRLQELAPEKYSYMKNRHFNGKEFKEKPWTKVKWPELHELLANDQGCSETLNECFKSIRLRGKTFEVRGVSTKEETGTFTMIHSSTSLPLVLQDSFCINEYKKNKLKDFEDRLLSDDNFCQYGGKKFIHLQKDKICQKIQATLVENFQQASELDLSTSISRCVTSGDVEKCVLSSSLESLKIPQRNLPSVEVFLKSIISNELKAIEKARTTAGP